MSRVYKALLELARAVEDTERIKLGDVIIRVMIPWGAFTELDDYLHATTRTPNDKCGAVAAEIALVYGGGSIVVTSDKISLKGLIQETP
jgi:hypothetical protein